MTNAASERSQRKLRKQQLADQETETLVLRTLMSSVDGRRYIWLQLSETFIFQADTDLRHEVLAWRAGMRNRGLRLLAAVTIASPEGYIRMTQENSAFKPKEEPDDRSDEPDIDG